MTKNKNKDIKKVFAPTAKSRTNTNYTTTTNYTEKTSKSQDNFQDTVKIEGINNKGFGIIPKLVMQDRRLSIQAKAIYAYFCSYAGNGETAFPGRDKILYDLHIGKQAYYNHFNLLKQYGYIQVEQVRKNGQFTRNIYTISQVINIPCTDFRDTAKPDTGNQYINNNSIKNNNIKNNKSSLSSLSISEDIKDKTGQDEPHRQTPSMPSIETCQQYLKDNINYEELKTTHPQDMPLVDECIQIMLDTIFTNKPGVRINRENKPKELVVSTLMKVTCADIVHVIYQFNNQTTPIKRKAAYILTMLYMSTLERHAHYRNMVRADWGAIRGPIDRK